MPRVDSRAVDWVDHDPATGTLEIRYTGGARYAYFAVPRAVYEALLAAESIGAFVNAEVKPNYRFEMEPGRRRFPPREE